MNKRLLPVVVLLALAPAVELGRLVWQTPPMVVLAALGPALALAGVIVALPRARREPPEALLAAFLCGTVLAAFLSVSANALLQAWIATLAGDDVARSITPRIVGPAVEEVSKAVALALLVLARRDTVSGAVSGMIYGALIGVGFAMTENLQYFLLAAVQGGTGGLGQALYTRALLGGLNHVVFTATMGAGLGWGRGAASRTVRWVAPALGLAWATLEHIAWNVVASQQITQLLCNPDRPEGPCRGAPDATSLLLTAPLIAIAFIGPGMLILAAVARAAARNPRRT